VILKIKCPKCNGPMWEDELPETPRHIDLACLVCGERRIFKKADYRKAIKRIEERVDARIRRALPSR
jgi:hypothetical protein